jgi:hypothetical protein
MSDGTDDLPEGYRWATADECETFAADPGGHPEMIIVTRTADASGRPYTEGEADVAILVGLMPYDEAISMAIFAINTLMYPDASDPADIDLLEMKSSDVIKTLDDIRATVRGLTTPEPAPPRWPAVTPT